MAKVKVRVKSGCSHRVPAPEWKGDSARADPAGMGSLAHEGEEIEVTEAELAVFGDKFEIVQSKKSTKA